METKNKLGYTFGGIVIGILLAGYGVTFMRDTFPTEPVVVTNVVSKKVTEIVKVPVVQERVITKVVTKEVIKPVTEKQLWKAIVTDKKGNSVEYIVRKVKYTIINATLTDMNGNEINVGTNDLQVQRID